MTPPCISLQSAKKWCGTGVHRVISPQETCRRIRPLMSSIEVTRLGDITGLDCIGIPVYTAFRPCDEGPGKSVSCGKGISPVDACVGAMMEAVERYSAEVLCQGLVTGTYDEVSRHADALDPIHMQRYSTTSYDKGMVVDWVSGTDLLSGFPLLVPAQLVGFPWFGRGCRTSFQSTNGLASGNIMDEAIAHALAEVIERDALTLAVVKSQLAPGIQQWIHSMIIPCQEKIPFDDIPPSCSPPDDIQTDILPSPLDTLVRRVRSTGAHFWLKDITSDLDIPSFTAGILQEIQPGKNFVGMGFGTHPDRTVAAARAITEAVLGRAVQLQGAREQMGKTYEDRSPVDSPGMWWKDSDHAKPLECLPSFEHDDILDDNLLMLDRLKRRGVSHVIAVDLTHKRLGIPVVRLIVPELEFWSAFDFDPKCCTLGEKALSCLQ